MSSITRTYVCEYMCVCDYLCCGIANRQQCFSQKITTVSTQCYNGTKARKHNGIPYGDSLSIG